MAAHMAANSDGIVFHFLGTGGAQQVPAFGCECEVCQQAQRDEKKRRRACCVAITTQDRIILIDAGLPELAPYLLPYPTRHILLTHYHMDHVQGLFPLRWGYGDPIPVFSPPDEAGCDDLFKHPGILHFQPPLVPFQPFELDGISITPVPLIHSKLTYGYLIQTPTHTLAYLTDTIGLPPDTAQFLASHSLDYAIVDCSHPPQTTPPRNHNDTTRALEIFTQLNPKQLYLTHIGHELDRWFQTQTLLPENVHAAYDGLVLGL
ncbi:phosphonate metabolism protein PhnP [Pectobacterium polaris]|nr:phosphonate metabolism protein PhnP [Pectobacterium polaris]UAY91574.1 phosphonate metabolism protein PhnP [Pectobacterium polaris]